MEYSAAYDVYRSDRVTGVRLTPPSSPLPGCGGDRNEGMSIRWYSTFAKPARSSRTQVSRFGWQPSPSCFQTGVTRFCSVATVYPRARRRAR